VRRSYRRIVRLHPRRDWRTFLRHQMADSLFSELDFRCQICVFRDYTLLHLHGSRTIRPGLQLSPTRADPVCIYSLPGPIPPVGTDEIPQKNPANAQQTKQIRNSPDNNCDICKLAGKPVRRHIKLADSVSGCQLGVIFIFLNSIPVPSDVMQIFPPDVFVRVALLTSWSLIIRVTVVPFAMILYEFH